MTYEQRALTKEYIGPDGFVHKVQVIAHYGKFETFLNRDLSHLEAICIDGTWFSLSPHQAELNMRFEEAGRCHRFAELPPELGGFEIPA